jgi:DNA mismatch repair protein MutS2
MTTTHYEGLKALALVDPRFENASVGFDMTTMTPTFVLARGIPGRSSALAVARRFGMPATVVERAERFLTREDRSFEAVVEQLHGERAALELARAAAQEREHEALVTRTRLEAETAALRDRERRTLSEEARALLAQMQRAREELRDARARVRTKKADAQAIREAERSVERVAGDFAIGGALEPFVAPAAREPEPAGAPQLRRGARVWVARLRAEAEILEVLGDGQVRVAAGALKLTVPGSELRGVAALEGAAPVRRAALGEPAPARAEASDANPIQTDDVTCDLRGLRVDDALSLATSFLDRALNEGRRAVFLVHGHGTGALRDAVREELARSPYVARFRAGAPDRGGEGVTIAWLT